MLALKTPLISDHPPRRHRGTVPIRKGDSSLSGKSPSFPLCKRGMTGRFNPWPLLGAVVFCLSAASVLWLGYECVKYVRAVDAVVAKMAVGR